KADGRKVNGHLVDGEGMGELQLGVGRVGVAGVEEDGKLEPGRELEVRPVSRVVRVVVQVAEVTLEGDDSAGRDLGLRAAERIRVGGSRVGDANRVEPGD